MDEEIRKRLGENEASIKEYAKQIATLRDDLKVALRFSHPNVVQQARHYVNNLGSHGLFSGGHVHDAEFDEMVKGFLERYGLLDGSTL